MGMGWLNVGLVAAFTLVLCVMSSSGKKTLETDIASVSDKNKEDKNCHTVARFAHCSTPLPSPQKVPHRPPSPSILQQHNQSVSDPAPIPCPAHIGPSGPSPGIDAPHPSPPSVIQEYRRRLKRQSQAINLSCWKLVWMAQ